MLKIDVSNCHDTRSVEEQRLRQAAEAILRDSAIGHAELSIAIVDDATIQPLNRQYLGHDYPTDVLSFLLDRQENRLEGEVVVSVETAARAAAEYGWSTGDELLLYVIHGMLHLVGHDDATPDEQAAMRRHEQRYLAAFGVALGDHRGVC
jgi:probable rRNA maturation factor